MKDITRNTIKIDAEGQTVGRLSTKIAMTLMGKTKPSYAPHIDGGDMVHIVNAGKVRFTGNKLVQKDYLRHTMHPGGLVRTPMKQVFENDPGKVIRHAVYGMLPKNKLRDRMMKRLTIDV